MSATIGILNITAMEAFGLDVTPVVMVRHSGGDFCALHMPAHVCRAVADAFKVAMAVDDAPMPEVHGDSVTPLHGGEVG